MQAHIGMNRIASHLLCVSNHLQVCCFTIRVWQQKIRLTNARHHALRNAHHMMLVTVFANQRASKWLCHSRKTGQLHLRKPVGICSRLALLGSCGVIRQRDTIAC